jgi:hypothetical protein
MLCASGLEFVSRDAEGRGCARDVEGVSFEQLGGDQRRAREVARGVLAVRTWELVAQDGTRVGAHEDDEGAFGICRCPAHELLGEVEASARACRREAAAIEDRLKQHLLLVGARARCSPPRPLRGDALIGPAAANGGRRA